MHTTITRQTDNKSGAKKATREILKGKETGYNWVTPDIADFVALPRWHRCALLERTYQRFKNNGATEAKYKFPFCISPAMRG